MSSGEVCTSSVRQELQPGVNWPVCMRTFAHRDELRPAAEAAGLEAVVRPPRSRGSTFSGSEV